MAMYLGSNQVAVTTAVETGGGGGGTDMSSHFTFANYITVKELSAIGDGSTIKFNAIVQVANEGYFDVGFLQTDTGVSMVNNQPLLMLQYNSSNSTVDNFDIVFNETSLDEFDASNNTWDTETDVYLSTTIVLD